MSPLQQDMGREGRCVPKQDSWDVERFAGRASCPVPPHLVTTIHPLLSFLLSRMDQVPLGHSQVAISPEEEEEDPLWSAPFPGALFSGFQAFLGTFPLMSPSRSFSLSSLDMLPGIFCPSQSLHLRPGASRPVCATALSQIF